MHASEKIYVVAVPSSSRRRCRHGRVTARPEWLAILLRVAAPVPPPRSPPLPHPTLPSGGGSATSPSIPILCLHSLVFTRLHPPLRPGHMANLSPLLAPRLPCPHSPSTRTPVLWDLLAVCHEPMMARSSSMTPTTSRSCPHSPRLPITCWINF